MIYLCDLKSYGKMRGMKKNRIILLLLFSACIASAQVQTGNSEFSIKGDEAMNNLDYILAKSYYEVEVISNCDLHSVDQLARIWVIDSSLRANMNVVMEKCFSCLEEKAANNSDTASIKMLISFYAEGIGADQNQAKADYWEQQLETIRNPFPNNGLQNGTIPAPEKEKMQFFAGYSATFHAPFGLTVGGVGKTVGWYLRFRSNLSFQDYTEVYDGIGNITGAFNNTAMSKPLNIKSANTIIGTGGIVIKATPSFFISVGAGYCSREVLYKFEKINISDANPQGTFWAKYEGETSFKGVALDLDGAFKIGRTCYGSLGCSMLNFKYISANAGIGVFF